MAQDEEWDTLEVRLRAIEKQVADGDPAFAAAVEGFIARLKSAYSGQSTPKPGEPFPAFLLPSTDGRLVVLEALLGVPLVIAFLRGHWCPYCRAQTDAFSSVVEQLADVGAHLLVITPERSAYASLLMQAASNVTMLCDSDNGFAAGLGLLAIIDAHFAELLQASGYDLPLYQGSQLWSVPIPATFVLDRKGVVVASAIDPDYRKRMSISALMSAVAIAARS